MAVRTYASVTAVTHSSRDSLSCIQARTLSFGSARIDSEMMLVSITKIVTTSCEAWRIAHQFARRQRQLNAVEGFEELVGCRSRPFCWSGRSSNRVG